MNKDQPPRIEDILGSLAQTPRAAAPDFFYTRLKARMESALVAKPRKSVFLRPVYILGALLLVLAVNAAVILKGNTSNIETASSDADIMQSIASEYRINTNLTYEINQ
jgi:hypothetical protein